MQVHYEMFHAINPASTCVVVASLVHPALLVEIEVDAIIVRSKLILTRFWLKMIDIR